MQKELKALLKAKQPGAIGYNGGGISANPARWSKTEGDVPPGPGAPTAPGAGAANSSGIDVWSTGCNDTGEKTVFLSHLSIKMLILPRQARDKHRENSKTDRFVAQTGARAALPRTVPIRVQLCSTPPALTTRYSRVTCGFTNRRARGRRRRRARCGPWTS